MDYVFSVHVCILAIQCTCHVVKTELVLGQVDFPPFPWVVIWMWFLILTVKGLLNCNSEEINF